MVTIRSSSSEVSSPALCGERGESVRHHPRIQRPIEGYKPLVEIDIGLLADQVGVTASDALDLGQSVHDLLLSLDVGVEETQDELEVRLLSRDERCMSREVISIFVIWIHSVRASGAPSIGWISEYLHMMAVSLRLTGLMVEYRESAQSKALDRRCRRSAPDTLSEESWDGGMKVGLTHWQARLSDKNHRPLHVIILVLRGQARQKA